MAATREAFYGCEGGKRASGEEAHDVRRDASSAGVTASGSHRRVFAVLSGDLRCTSRPNLFHARSVGEVFWHRVGTNAATAIAGSRVVSRFLVGAPGFEPGTSCPPDKRANQAAPRPVDR